jgi:thiamine biosynthesis protein ThiS
MMTVVLNGETHKIESGINLDQLLDLFSLPKKRVAIERNGDVVLRGEWENTHLSEGDRLEVVHFVGGG